MTHVTNIIVVYFPYFYDGLKSLFLSIASTGLVDRHFSVVIMALPTHTKVDKVCNVSFW